MTGKRIVEFGCLEGMHTVSLCSIARSVIAIDARDINIRMTRERCSLFGFSPELRKVDLEGSSPPSADLHYHIGVLYHLQDPIEHLKRLASTAPELALGTHYATNTNDVYKTASGEEFRAYRYRELVENTRSGVRVFSRWLLYEDLMRVLGNLYKTVKVLSKRTEENGPRVTLVASNNPLAQF